MNRKNFDNKWWFFRCCKNYSVLFLLISEQQSTFKWYVRLCQWIIINHLLYFILNNNNNNNNNEIIMDIDWKFILKKILDQL
jgi:hypothetical protein